MAVLEILIIKLKQSFESTKDLESDESVSKAIEIIRRQPGCLGSTVGLFEEDRSKALFLIEWNTLRDHVEVFAASADHKPLLAEIGKIMAERLYFGHFEAAHSPKQLVNSNTPVLEVYIATVKAEASFDDFKKTFNPLFQHFKADGRKFITAPALDEAVKKDVAFLAPWKSIDEHEAGKKEKFFTDFFTEHKKVQAGVKAYGHVILGTS